MGYSRQVVAIGFAMLAITKLQTGSISRFVIWIAVAAMFHKTAVLLIPFALFSVSRNRTLTFIGVGLSTVILFVFLLQEQLNYFMLAFIEAEYASSGAAIRIAMNVIPAFLFLIFKKRFVLDTNILSFWTWMAWGTILLVLILMVSPSSTAVDRIALYWIPLQLVIFSRLPDAFGVSGRRNPLWVYLIVAYSSTVMLAWLFFAETAHAWVPYRFYPWEWLWS